MATKSNSLTAEQAAVVAQMDRLFPPTSQAGRWDGNFHARPLADGGVSVFDTVGGTIVPADDLAAFTQALAALDADSDDLWAHDFPDVLAEYEDAEQNTW